MAVQLKTYNEILGELVRKMIADTSVNDLNRGSVLMSILEAVAAQDFENSASVLSVLESLNIDSLRNADLDTRAADYGLTRITANRAIGTVKISDTSISKRSASLYAVKPAPIAGQTILYVNDASTWSNTGELYIGRGTVQFEGPISYTSVTNNGTFFTIQLSSALQKDHLLSDTVVDRQGTSDRLISSGLTVRIPANSQSPEINYTVLRDAVLPAGEDHIDGVAIVASKAGSAGNAGIGTIIQFTIDPFVGAGVTNTSPATDGRDIEIDDDLRLRIKSYTSTLARGTRAAILAAVVGVSDQTDGKQVASVTITEPLSIGEPAIVYIDDGSGFQPSYLGQGVDPLISSANGDELFLQLSQFPIPRPQVVNLNDGPFQLSDGMNLVVSIDDQEEIITFSASSFNNISSATLSEIISAINDQALAFRCRFILNSTRLLLYPIAHDAEFIKVSSYSVNSLLDANSVINFPTNKVSYISLYKNNALLSERQFSAYVQSLAVLNVLNGTATLSIEVDGTPAQTRSFTSLDFEGTQLSAVTAEQWSVIFNTSFAGITSSITSSGKIQIASNKIGADSSVAIVSGSLVSEMFGGAQSAQGKSSDFILNRQTGNVELRSALSVGDSVTAGSTDTKGSVTSNAAAGGTFNLSTDSNSRQAEMVFVADDTATVRPVLPSGSSSLTFAPGSSTNLMKISSSSLPTFLGAQLGDYIYIAKYADLSFASVNDSGLFRIVKKGSHDILINAYIEVVKITQDALTTGIQDSGDVQVFSSDTYPQVWSSTLLATPATASLADIVTSINNNLSNVKSSIFKTSSVRATSTTENGGSIGLPVSMGRATTMFATKQNSVSGNQSHVATKITDKDLSSLFRRTTPSKSPISMGGYSYSDVKATLTAAATPDNGDFQLYNEQLFVDAVPQIDDLISSLDGANQYQYRSIRELVSATQLRTQIAKPRTNFDYLVGDKLSVIKSVSIAADDSVVFILDGDAVNKTININFWRTGRVSSSAIPSTTSFSAWDADNEVGVDFGNLQTWSKTTSGTEFSDYAVWMKAHNWYQTGGAGSGGAAMILRAKEWGPNGNKYKFSIEYPQLPSQAENVYHANTPEGTSVVYSFASDSAKLTNIISGQTFAVSSLGGGNFRYTFNDPIVDFSTLTAFDLMSITNTSGVSAANRGTFKVNAFNVLNRTIDIYNPSGSATFVGNPEVSTVATVADVAGSLAGLYFTIYDAAGSVAVWISTGATIEPIHGKDRSIQVTISANDSANTIASILSATVGADAAFSTSVLSNTVTITDVANGVRTPISADTSTFAVAVVTPGVNNIYESLLITSGIAFYELSGNDVQAIADKISLSEVMTAVPVGNATLKITKSTRQEVYTDSGESSRLGYGHDQAGSERELVRLYDGESFVKTFSNLNPYFVLKTPLNLIGVTPTYNVATCPNSGSADVGEFFRLIPKTPINVKHHMSHRALSQLPIIADVEVAHSGKRVQVKSKKLGTAGVVEVVGGRANLGEFSISGDSSVIAASGTDYLQMNVSAFPATLSTGNVVKVYNDKVAKRKSRFSATDKISVVQTGSLSTLNLQSKDIQSTAATKWTITDVSGSYSTTAGTVWRWTHNQAGSKAQILAKANGTVGSAPQVFDATGVNITSTGDTKIVDFVSGSASTKSSFDILLEDVPTQADFILYLDKNGNQYAAWYSVDANVTAPTAVSFLAVPVGKRTMVSITSIMTPNDISTALVTALPLNANHFAAFGTTQTSGTNLNDVIVGDQVYAARSDTLNQANPWKIGNLTHESGVNVNKMAIVVGVNTVSRYFDLLNPIGRAMSSTLLGSNGEISFYPSTTMKWKFNHNAIKQIDSSVVSSLVCTAYTADEHKFSAGDVVTITGNTLLNAIGVTITSTPDTHHFTFATAAADTLNAGEAVVQLAGESATTYKVQKIGFNSLVRVSKANGTSPRFLDAGVTVDDTIEFSGNTWLSANRGSFSVIAVDQDSVIIENDNAIEQLHYAAPISTIPVTFTAGVNFVTGVSGSFSKISVGMWVKSEIDGDDKYMPVTAVAPTQLTLLDVYSGTTGTNSGTFIDQVAGANYGAPLMNTEDIKIYESDSTFAGDTLFIESVATAGWFSSANTGTRAIAETGVSISGQPYLKVSNAVGVSESDRDLGIKLTGLYVIESESKKYESYREVNYAAISPDDSSKRTVYLSPATRADKVSQDYGSKIKSMGKMGFEVSATTGVDGYLYYTGLMRTVQRTIDGYEPDQTTYPGRRAVGSAIEVLPSLIKKITISLAVTTKEGVNLTDVTNEIKTSIISYISGLGVGDDVILSEIIANVMNISGIAAVTFTTPAPTTERITIADDQRAYLAPESIFLS